MAVYYKFKSAKDYNSVAIDGHFISVGHLKEKIFEMKHLGRGTDFDLVVTNAQTNEEYLDEGMLIPKNTSVSIRRVPGYPRKPIKTAPAVSEQEEEPNVQAVVKGSSFAGVTEEFVWDEFGNDVYAIPETVPVHSSNQVSKEEEEESKIKALIETSAFDWQHQPFDGRRRFGRGGFEKKTTPPQGYTCHRCKVAGHFIQHCPTNGDPNFDVKKRAVAVLKPNEAAFEKEMEGMPSTRSVIVDLLPPELHCPLCKQGMKDAVFTSKCCFKSFCDTCIRDHVISKAMCVCGATNVLADDLLPNKTLRDTINRILLQSNIDSSSDDKVGSALIQVQDMESRNPQAKVPPSQRDETATPLADEELQQNPPISPGNNKKKIHKPPGAAAQTTATAQDFPPDQNNMMPCAFNPYWNGGFMPFGGPMPYMGGYGINNPMPFGCMLPYGPPQPHKKSDHRRSRDIEYYDSSAPKKRKLSNGHHELEHKRWGRENVVRPLLV